MPPRIAISASGWLLPVFFMVACCFWKAEQMSAKAKSARRRAQWQVDNLVHTAFRQLNNNHAARVALELLIAAVKPRTRLLKPASGPRGWRDAELFLRGLVNLALHQHYWKNPLYDWPQPPAAGARVQWNHLVQHLFDCPQMPFFMHSVWLTPPEPLARKMQSVYRQMASGRSIRGCSAPVKLSRKAARYFHVAADHLSAQQALRWAQARGAGARRALADAVATSVLSDNFSDEEYCRIVIDMLVRHEAKVIAPLAIYHRIGPLLQRIQRYRDNFPVDRLNELDAGGFEIALRRNGWLPWSIRNTWPPSGIAGFCWYQMDESGWLASTWKISELLDNDALQAEGHVQHNCVAMYKSSCLSQVDSIWSMVCTSGRKIDQRVTIRVKMQDRQIVEAMGPYNCALTETARAVLQQWARKERLSFAKWV